MKTWLLLDMNNLAYRAFYALGGLRFENKMTGVVFGILRDILKLQELYNTTLAVFCFDHGTPLRKQLFPGYKQSRMNKEESEEEKKAREELRVQIANLKHKHLTGLGFRNVFFKDGLEADDIIASCCRTVVRKQEDAVLVSSDKDLYQLLCFAGVSIWNPHENKPVTANSFVARYGISPTWWPTVKAIAGCDSDDIPGVRGVGEITACKYITQRLKKTSSAYVAIKRSKWKGNLPLVTLPFPTTPDFELQEDKIDKEAWTRLADELGMKSIRNLLPGSKEWAR